MVKCRAILRGRKSLPYRVSPSHLAKEPDRGQGNGAIARIEGDTVFSVIRLFKSNELGDL